MKHFDAMDSVKVELVRKNELLKEDLMMLKAVDFKPAGKGLVWPQFQSVQPGRTPWFIEQTEAEQLLVDLPRLTAFITLFRNQANLFDNRSPTEIPFLPDPLPSRLLEVKDLEWKPMVASPETFEPFKATAQQLDQLHKLKHEPQAAFEYGSQLLMGSKILEEGRPCYSRINLLVERGNGLVLGIDLSIATVPFAQSAGTGLVKALVSCGSLPGTLLIDDNRLESVLGSFCHLLNIDLLLSEELEGLAEASASLDNYMGGGRF